jgi:hypothetical protein
LRPTTAALPERLMAEERIQALLANYGRGTATAVAAGARARPVALSGTSRIPPTYFGAASGKQLPALHV